MNPKTDAEKLKEALKQLKESILSDFSWLWFFGGIYLGIVLGGVLIWG